MNQELMIDQLEANFHRIISLCSAVTPAQARFRPDSQSWSMLEVINHLFDEERLDFRVRLDILLHRPAEPWPPIDPGGWVTARQYSQHDFETSMTNFSAERRASLRWLRSLPNPDWNSQISTPWGSICAGDMFAAWVAHDTLHMRQFVELLHAWVDHQAGAYITLYAGDW